MRGDAKARQTAAEEQIALHWLSAQMRTLAPAGKLGPLDRWLDHVRPAKPRTVEDMILALQDAAAQGAPITFEQVKG